MDFSKHVQNRRATPQTEKVTGVKKQKKNNAGGVSFKITKWDYMLRFLILGTEGGTYYVSERKLTRAAANNVQKCIDSDGKKAVATIVDVSTAGRASNNDAAIFALAMAASCNDPITRKLALDNLHNVCRIGTHLFHFVAFVKTMRGFGRGLREALARWYTHKPIDKLAYQMLKYQGRDGWTHGDILRLAHPVPMSKEMGKMFKYAAGKKDQIPRVSDYATGMRKIRKAETPKQVAKLIRDFSLTREAVPTEFMKNVDVNMALLESMPIGALLRNLGNHAALGMHTPLSDSLNFTLGKLTDENYLLRGRIHPISIMNALLVYKSRRGVKGGNSWNPSPKIISALESAFYKSFGGITPTHKNIMLALDVSGSMRDKLANSYMSCRVASAVLSMVTARIEPNTFVVGFTSDGENALCFGRHIWGSDSISELSISPEQRIDDVVANISGLNFGATDCSLPMIYAAQNDIDVDAICIYTDNETYAGSVHPWQALDSYQNQVGHEVKLIVVGMTSSGFSIARPDYKNMLDVVGFDTNTPTAISEFIRN